MFAGNYHSVFETVGQDTQSLTQGGERYVESAPSRMSHPLIAVVASVAVANGPVNLLIDNSIRAASKTSAVPTPAVP